MGDVGKEEVIFVQSQIEADELRIWDDNNMCEWFFKSDLKTSLAILVLKRSRKDLFDKTS